MEAQILFPISFMVVMERKKSSGLLLVISENAKYSLVRKTSSVPATAAPTTASLLKCYSWLLTQGKTLISMIVESKLERIAFQMYGAPAACSMSFLQENSCSTHQIICNSTSESRDPVRPFSRKTNLIRLTTMSILSILWSTCLWGTQDSDQASKMLWKDSNMFMPF